MTDSHCELFQPARGRTSFLELNSLPPPCAISTSYNRFQLLVSHINTSQLSLTSKDFSASSGPKRFADVKLVRSKIGQAAIDELKLNDSIPFNWFVHILDRLITEIVIAVKYASIVHELGIREL